MTPPYNFRAVKTLFAPDESGASDIIAFGSCSVAIESENPLDCDGQDILFSAQHIYVMGFIKYTRSLHWRAQIAIYGILSRIRRCRDQHGTMGSFRPVR